MIENLKFDKKSGDISWEYEDKTYTIKAEHLYDVKAFEKEERILVLCGNFQFEDHLYAYDFYGNFLFEVMPPSEKYEIVHITAYPEKVGGFPKKIGARNIMAMFCLAEDKNEERFDSAYYIDPNTGELTFAGRIKY